MRFEVPQYIEIEDKIFGPLSWRQFLYLGGGLGMAIALFLATPFLIFLLIGLPMALLAGALAFYPVNNRPFSFFLEAIYNYYRNSNLYLWKPKEDAVHRDRSVRAADSFVPGATPTTTRRLGGSDNVSSLARRLEMEVIQKEQQ